MYFLRGKDFCQAGRLSVLFAGDAVFVGVKALVVGDRFLVQGGVVFEIRHRLGFASDVVFGVRLSQPGNSSPSSSVGPDGVAVGLVGEGSIPSTGVRAVFLTATITAPAAGAMSIAGQAASSTVSFEVLAPQPTSTPAAGTNPRPLPASFGIDKTLSNSIKMGVDLRFPLDNSMLDVSKGNTDSKDSSKNRIKVSGGVAFSASMQVSVSLHLAIKISVEWAFIVPVPTVDDFTVEQTQTTKITRELDLYVKGSWEESITKDLATIRPVKVTFSIGPVPVVITSEIKLTFTLKASISAGIAMSIGDGVQRKQVYGFSYSTKNGLKNLRSDKTTSDDPIEPKDILKQDFNAELAAEAGIDASLSISLYDAFGPTFGVGVSVSASDTFTGTLNNAAQPPEEVFSASAKANISLNIKLYGKVQLKIPIIDKVLLNVDLFSANWNIPIIEQCWTSKDGFKKCDASQPDQEPGSSSEPSPNPEPSPSPSCTDRPGSSPYVPCPTPSPSPSPSPTTTPPNSSSCGSLQVVVFGPDGSMDGVLCPGQSGVVVIG